MIGIQGENHWHEPIFPVYKSFLPPHELPCPVVRSHSRTNTVLQGASIKCFFYKLKATSKTLRGRVWIPVPKLAGTCRCLTKPETAQNPKNFEEAMKPETETARNVRNVEEAMKAKTSQNPKNVQGAVKAKTAQNPKNVEEATKSKTAQNPKNVEEPTKSKTAKNPKNVEEAIKPETAQRPKNVEEAMKAKTAQNQKNVEEAMKANNDQNPKESDEAIKPETAERPKKVEKATKPETSRRPKNIQEACIFPPEVITEILSRLPVDTLSELQFVCKEWHALITDHHFIGKQMNYNPFVARHLFNVHVSYRRSNCDSVSFVQGCDGLLLLQNITMRKHCIWNPFLCRVLELPDPRGRSFGMAMLYVPATRNYRVVSAYVDPVSGMEGCEVFIPGHSTSWKRLNFPDVLNGIGPREYGEVSVVAAGEAVHCVLSIKVGDQAFEEVVSLDVATELFTVNKLPKYLSNVWSLDWEGKLAFARVVGGYLEVRQLADYKKQRWCEKMQVIHLAFMKGSRGGEEMAFPLFARKGKIWFWLKDKEIITYEIETGKVTGVENSESYSSESNFYPYQPSLVSFKGMQPDTRLKDLRPRFRHDY